MAIVKDNPSDKSKRTAEATVDPGFQESNQPRGAGLDAAPGLGRLNRRLQRNAMGEGLAVFMEQARSSLEESGEREGESPIRLLPMDANRYGLHYSAVVFVYLTEMSKNVTASFYTMILESTGMEPKAIQKNYQGENIEIVRTPMDAWDVTMLGLVQNVIIDQFGSDLVLLNAGATTVPPELDPKDKHQMQRLLVSANDLCQTAIETEYPDLCPHLEISEYINPREEKMVAQFTYGNSQTQSAIGLPARSDITMDVSTTRLDRVRDQDDYSGWMHRTGKDWFRLSAFSDLVYTGPQASPGYNQPAPTQVFYPRVTITHFDPMIASTPEMFFLALAQSQLLSDNNAWAGQFMSFDGKQDRDIGAIGYRLPDPNQPDKTMELIDTGSNAFGLSDLAEMLRFAVHSTPIYSLDCDDIGPMSWLTNAVLQAAHGHREANQYLISAMDNLTSGRFSSYYNSGDPIVVSENNRIHLGTYVSRDGDLRDIRDVDSLAVLTHFGHNDMATADAWEATFNDRQSPIEYRMHRRLEILKEMAHGKLKIRGTAERVTFLPAALDALVSACMDAGLMIEQEGLTSMVGSYRQVGNDFIGQYAAHGGAGGMIRRAGTVAPTAIRRPIGRWG